MSLCCYYCGVKSKMAAYWCVYFSTPRKVVFLLFFALTIATTSQAYFGVSSREPISGVLSAQQTNTKLSNRELCDSFHLHPRQKRTCRKERGMASTLLEAIRLSALECQRQFEFERWNCSLDFTRINLLEKEFKETSLLYALSSAGLIHAFSRSCSGGALDQCTCDESFSDSENERTWRWGGCGDNVASGQKFARRFLNRKKHKHKDLRALVDQHNSEVGIRVVKDMVTKKCKCHGLSGTCTVKICWMQLAPFDLVGKRLKSKYDAAVVGNNRNDAHLNFAIPSSTSNSDVTGINNDAQRHRRSGGHYAGRKKALHKLESANNVLAISETPAPSIDKDRQQRGGSGLARDVGATRGELVYLDKSPDFCGKSRYSAGTRGRVCLKGNNCQELCCGRGHNVQLKTVSEACNCKVVWCCRVVCHTCTSEREIYTCK